MEEDGGRKRRERTGGRGKKEYNKMEKYIGRWKKENEGRWRKMEEDKGRCRTMKEDRRRKGGRRR
jgi:hypothetical protein